MRPIRELVDEALGSLSPAFSKLYARDGRPSIPPERLLRALLLQAFYTVRSERLLMQQLDYNLLFRWFVGLSADDPVWDATVFCRLASLATISSCMSKKSATGLSKRSAQAVWKGALCAPLLVRLRFRDQGAPI